MDQILFTVLSIIIIFILGSLAHFLYDLSNDNKVFGLFAAVNESTWEHVKIAITPTILWSLVDGYCFGDNPNYFTAKLASFLILSHFIPLVFYSYTRFSKTPILFINILTFLVSIILSQFSFIYIVNLPSVPYWATFLSVIGCFAFFGAYITLTFMPIRKAPFKDPVTGQYGFRAHRHLFKHKKK